MSYDLFKTIAQVTHPAKIQAALQGGQTPKATMQWFLSGEQSPTVTHRNTLSFFICGQQGFAAIAKDMAQAQHSIDIIAWGFDPAMELKRCPGTWPRGQTYGQLLEEKAKAGCQVRMLIWNHDIGRTLQHNLVGYDEAGQANFTGAESGLYNANSTPRLEHCKDWWRRALAGDMANLEVRFRSPDDDHASALRQKTFPEAGNNLT